MKAKMIKALWGMNGTLEEQVALISKAGYAGIEAAPPSAEDADRFKLLLDEYQLEYVAMVFTGGEDHGATFEEQVKRAVEFRPQLINAHSAKDSMPFDKQVEFFSKALEIEQQAGIPIGHETHRGRALFTPWSAVRLLEELPELKITADLSHWCCVCESLLEDQTANLARVFNNVIHIHARVGYAQGPQVPHPSAPEYSRELEAHEAWWQHICRLRKANGFETITFTPEFGPPGYLQTLPFTNQPVADLWELCLWMTRHIERRFPEWQ